MKVVVRVVSVRRNRNRVYSCRALELVVLQAVESGHFAGKGAQRGGLYFFLLRDLLKLL